MKKYDLSDKGLASLIRTTIDVDQPFSYLEEFTNTLYNSDDIQTSLPRHQQKVIDEVLDWYNFFTKEYYFHENKALNKMYSKQAALYEGYMYTLDRLEWINTDNWVFDPTQQDLFYK